MPIHEVGGMDSAAREEEPAMSEASAVLTAEMRDLALHEGAVLFGVAGVDRFEGAPRGHHPAEIVMGAQTVIVFGIPMVEQVADWDEMFRDSELLGPEIRNTMLQDYLYREVNYNFINDRLGQIALRLTLSLQGKGFRSTLFPSTFGPQYEKFHDMMPGWMGLFSQRHAAVRAGLGEFGLNNVVVTPEYGPRVRFNSVLTQAPLQGSPLLQEKACLGTSCNVCVERCGGQAISLLPTFDETEVWLNPVSRTDKPLCRKRRKEVFCYGRCVAVCPVGLHTSSEGPAGTEGLGVRS
jgi:epoxyqueuosine reductase